MDSRVRIGVLATLLLGGLGWLAWWYDLAEPVTGPVVTALRSASPPQPTVVFVVLDTVRADHLSLCGYERPTSSTLETLRAQGASVSCGAVTPASWTLPSHASFFTGKPASEHRADFAQASGERVSSVVANGLDDRLPTLAETFRERGFQTVSVSANPVLGPALGLSRGFDIVRTDPGKMDATRVNRVLRETLRWDIARDQPLFLFLNIADAHDPYPAVPASLWGTAREPLDYARETDGSVFRRYLSDAMDAQEMVAFRAWQRDAYDQGVLQADAALGEALDTLRAHGWLDTGVRLVVTSDHGHYLGEHGLLDHGRAIHEPVVRVPLVVYSDVEDVPDLPETVAAIAVHDLVADGTLPAHPVEASAVPDLAWQTWFDGRLGTKASAATWHGTHKLYWEDGEYALFDLTVDPDETTPLPLPPDHPGRPALDALVEATLDRTAQKAATSDAQIEALRAIGYVGD